MKLNRRLIMVLALVMSLAMATTGTLAFLTDRDTVENTFTMGNVDIEVDEEFEQGSDLTPGVEVEKKAGITNTHKTSDAWVWMTVSVPAELDEYLVLEWADATPPAAKIDSPVHEGYVSYIVKHPNVLGPGMSTPKYLQSVTLSPMVDYQNGEYVAIVNGQPKSIGDLSKVKVIVDGYAMQTEGFDTVDAAYTAYTEQWGGLKGGESGVTGGAGVTMPTTTWAEEADTTWYDASKTTFTIDTAAELAGLSKLVYEGNTFSGKTIELGADIDLGGNLWTPIGRMIDTSGIGENSTFRGDFDGKNYTVSNLYIDTVDGIAGSDDAKGAALFGATSGSVKNLTVDTAVIKTAHWAGAIAGSADMGSIVNCHAKNITIECLPELIGSSYDNGDKAGGIAGYVSNNASVENCSVTNADITGYRDIGGLVGYANVPVKNSSINNVTLTLDNTNNYKNYTANKDYDFGAYVGEVGGKGSVSNCTGTATINYSGEGEDTDNTVSVSNSAELKNAIENASGSTTIKLADGEYTTNVKVPGGANITITGSDKAVLSGQIATTSSTAGTITLKGVTYDVDSSIQDSTGISQTSKSAIAVWGNQTVVCEDVTFNMSLNDSSAISAWWDTGVGTSIVVKNCTFNANGQRPIRATGNVTVENSVFNDPYRYAVQLTAKTSTATDMDKAIINFKNNTIVNGENGKDFVYGIQLEGEQYGCNDLVINGSGNTIKNGGTQSTMYYCECGKVDHASVTFNTEFTPVHAE
ncbi:MAG: hypothetical protein J6M47_07660 [Clostridia bacterium]|nr:hypothetical protein [Clostridia bacterium]